MGNLKKNKKNKIKNEWNNVDKSIEIKKIKENIYNLGLNENFEEINYFFKILEEYNNNNLSFSGNIKIPSIKKNLNYQLPLSKKHHFIVSLKEYQ